MYLRPGDVVECEIERIGTLSQPGDLLAGGLRRAGAAAAPLVSTMGWPLDSAKLDRVRALMADAGARHARRALARQRLLPDQLLADEGLRRRDLPARGRADADRDGAPATRRPQRTAWTADVRPFPFYDPRDPRPPAVRAQERCARAAGERDRGRVGLERSQGTQAADRMVGEPTVLLERLVRRLRRGRERGPRRGAAARARAHDQDRAGDRADAPRERDRARRDGARARQHPPRDARERGRRDVRGRTCTRTAPATQGKVELARALHARLVGARDPHLHRDRPPAGARRRADAARDLGLRRRLLVRPDQERLPGRRCGASTTSCSTACSASTARAVDARPPGREPRRARRADPRRASPRSATPASPATRSATASARAPTSRRSPTGPCRRRSRRAWCSRSSRASTGRAAAACALEDNYLVTATGSEKLSGYPDDFRARVIETRLHHRRRNDRQPARRAPRQRSARSAC